MVVAAPVLFEKEFVTWLADTTPLVDEVREDARTQIKLLVGSQIYASRRPIGTGPLALTLERIGGNVDYHLRNQIDVIHQMIDITVWAKEIKTGTPATLHAMNLSEYIRRLLTAFRGTIGAVTVQQIELENEPFADAVSPVDASDNWAFRYVMPYAFWFKLATLPADA